MKIPSTKDTVNCAYEPKQPFVPELEWMMIRGLSRTKIEMEGIYFYNEKGEGTFFPFPNDFNNERRK
jgi:hypothetical protein